MKEIKFDIEKWTTRLGIKVTIYTEEENGDQHHIYFTLEENKLKEKELSAIVENIINAVNKLNE